MHLKGAVTATTRICYILGLSGGCWAATARSRKNATTHIRRILGSVSGGCWAAPESRRNRDHAYMLHFGPHVTGLLGSDRQVP